MRCGGAAAATMVAVSLPVVEFVSGMAITMLLECESEPADPGSGRARLAGLPAASAIVPPLADRASVPV